MVALNELELDHLATRLARVGITDVRPLPGGASSLTYAATFAGRRAVVKVAPPGVMPTQHRDVLRQARMIRVLDGSVPVPEMLWEDEGDPPDEPPLFVMSYVDGESVEPLFDRDASATALATMSERMRNGARVMAALHCLEPTRLGLGSEPIAGPAREVERWSATLRTVDPALVPGWTRVAQDLESTVPEPLPPAIVHGDFRLGNLLAHDDDVVSVIDWEIWSIGDPRIDLGWFLINADPDTYRRLTPYSGTTPEPAELAEVYAAAVGRDVPDVDWFKALACFKSAATWSLIVKHNRRRPNPDPELEAMATAPIRLLARAGHFLDAPTPDGGGR